MDQGSREAGGKQQTPACNEHDQHPPTSALPAKVPWEVHSEWFSSNEGRQQCPQHAQSHRSESLGYQQHQKWRARDQHHDSLPEEGKWKMQRPGPSADQGCTTVRDHGCLQADRLRRQWRWGGGGAENIMNCNYWNTVISFAVIHFDLFHSRSDPMKCRLWTFTICGLV